VATFDYNSLIDDVDAILEEMGTDAVFVSVNPGTYDAATNDLTGGGPSTYNTRAAFVPWDKVFTDGKKYEWDDQFNHGTQVRLEEVRALMSAKATNGTALPAPKTGDRVNIGSVDYQVIECKPIQPALVAVVYDLTLRN
jgi:hypothetical protein